MYTYTEEVEEERGRRAARDARCPQRLSTSAPHFALTMKTRALNLREVLHVSLMLEDKIANNSPLEGRQVLRRDLG